MAWIEAVVLGAIAGTIVEGGKRGLIKCWGDGELPAPVKAFVLAVLLVIPVLNAGVLNAGVLNSGTLGNYAITALATVGAFTVARWSVASAIVLWRAGR